MPRIETTVSDELDEWVRNEAKHRDCSKGEVLKIALESLRDAPVAVPEASRDTRNGYGDDIAVILATLELFIPRYIADHPKPVLTDDDRQVVNQRWATFKERRTAELGERQR